MLKVSAPGKLHLIGEHAVVFGEPAILAAVNRRTTLFLEKSSVVEYYDTRFDETPQEWSVEEVVETARQTVSFWEACTKTKDFQPLFRQIKENRYAGYRKSVVGIVLDRLGINAGVSGRIESDVPLGSGMGSSSSLSVALVKGIAALYNKNITLDEVNSIAYELEKIIHGTPSGGDNTAACYGGLLWFVKGEKPLSLGLPKFDGFVAVHIKTPEKTTGELVQHVRQFVDKNGNENIKAIGEATREMRQALLEKDFARVELLMNIAHQNLSQLGVSVPETDALCDAITAIGGGAKMCGAGGGGMVLCHHEDEKLLLHTIKESGYEPMEIELGTEGVRIEK